MFACAAPSLNRGFVPEERERKNVAPLVKALEALDRYETVDLFEQGSQFGGDVEILLLRSCFGQTSKMTAIKFSSYRRLGRKFRSTSPCETASRSTMSALPPDRGIRPQRFNVRYVPLATNAPPDHYGCTGENIQLRKDMCTFSAPSRSPQASQVFNLLVQLASHKFLTFIGPRISNLSAINIYMDAGNNCSGRQHNKRQIRNETAIVFFHFEIRAGMATTQAH